MKKLLITMVFLQFQINAYQQNDRIDSLLTLTNSTGDSIRLAANRDLAIEFMRNSTEKAIGYAEKALELARKMDNIREEGIALNLSGLGYSYLGNLSLSLDYYHQSLKIREKMGDLKMVSASLNNIGTIYVRQTEYEKAIETYLKALKIRQQTNDLSGQSQTLNNLGICYQRMGMPDKSLDCHLIGLEIKYKLGDEELIASSLTNIGRLYANRNQPDKALDYFNKALGYRNKNNDRYGKALTLFNIADVYEKKNDIHQALKTVQQALITIVHEFSDTSYLVNPHSGLVYPEEISMELLDYKARLLGMLYLSNRDIRILELSLRTYKQVVELLEIIKTDYAYEKDKLVLLRSMGDSFRHGAETATRLYRQSGNPTYIEEAFRFSEKYKANVLYELVRTDEARHFAGIPDSLIVLDRTLKKKLGDLQYKLHQSKMITNAFSISPDSLTDEIQKQRMELNDLEEHFRTQYPEYFELLYNDKTITLTEIQEILQPGQIVVEYFETGDSLEIFYINPDEYAVLSQKTDDKIKEWISSLRDLISTGHPGANQDSIVRQYCKQAYAVFSCLLEPLNSELSGKEIIVIPDGAMGTINFEMLVSDSVCRSGAAFNELPFLINRGTVVYGNSATLFFRQPVNDGKKRPTSGIAAFALSFQDFSPQSLKIREDTPMLTGTTKEVNEVFKMAGGKTFINREASEANFKQFASEYKIIHTATHGILDDQNPMFSHLQFYPDSATGEDGMLHAWELFDIKLNATLAVLSSCNSGYGKLESGEGMMTMARAFRYAGVPTLVISLWNVNDEATAIIMKDFYKNVNKGMNTSGALRKAKLTYLENSDNILSSPFFWAGFIQLGPDQELKYSGTSHFWWFVVLMGLILFVIVGKKRIRNN